MAKLLWGKVFYNDKFAGILQQEPGDRFSFIYEKDYIKTGNPPISFTLPLQTEPHISYTGLHSFFDNLIAEGWLENAQTRLLGKRQASRFELLLAFGFDCIGSVYVMDQEPERLSDLLLDLQDQKEHAVLTIRASLSGVQPKLAVIKSGSKYLPTTPKILSTHIAKFATEAHQDLVYNEYLATKALEALLPDDKVVQVKIGHVEGIDLPALLISRFDRENNQRLHFEEFNQLLEYKSAEKYNGSYKQMADFIKITKGCLPAENYKLFKRIVAGLLLGNTDMHFKNFAMLHASAGLRLSPIYDTVAAAIYDYKTIALSIAGASNIMLGKLKARQIVLLGQEFGLNNAAIKLAINEIEQNIDKAKAAIFEQSIGSDQLKNKLIDMVDKRWNGTLGLIGKALLEKQ